MTRRLGFLHAHHSNIKYIDDELARFAVEAVHFVDPGLVHRVTFDPALGTGEARRRVREQLQWICQCSVEAVVVTCTNYTALLVEDPLPVPVIPIDEPFFSKVCPTETEQLIFFTNPATVAGTMQRLRVYADANGMSPRVEAHVIENVFQLIMQGKTSEYATAVGNVLRDAVLQRSGEVSVAQLSMVTAAREIEAELGYSIGNPLSALSEHLGHTLHLRDR